MRLAELPQRIEDHPDARLAFREASGAVRTWRCAELVEDLERVRAYLLAQGLRRGSRAGIDADNAYAWVVLDIACVDLGIVLVAFSRETFAEDAELLARRYGLEILFSDRTLPTLAACRVAAIDAPLRHAPDQAKRKRGAAAGQEDDFFSLCFSSGSTGAPKAIVVSRAGAEYLLSAFLQAFGVSRGDGLYLFLPLSNFQQRLLVYAALWAGADIHFSTSEHLYDDFQHFRPTFLVAPPLLYRNLLKLFRLQEDGGLPLADLLGGRIRFMLVGMAPMDPEGIRAFHEQGLLLLESYGLSETGVIAWNTPRRCRVGSVGQPLDPRELLFSEEGEVLLRRRSPLCSRYFDVAGTNGDSTFRPDGLIATGDLGHLDEEGYLVLTGRKKNVVVTASGHKFQPEPIERRINQLPAVLSSVVYHSRRQQHNAAILNVQGSVDDKLVARLKAGIAELNASLSEHQRISRIQVNNDAYTAANRLLTDNMKINRSAIIERYAQ